MFIYVLMQCFYEGDSYLIDNAFECASENIQPLIDYAKNKHPNCEIFFPEDEVPDDGGYGDGRYRFRIMKTQLLD